MCNTIKKMVRKFSFCGKYLFEIIIVQLLKFQLSRN